MKNLKCSLAALLVAIAPGAMAQEQQTGQEFVWAGEFPVGSAIVDISASDQNGDIRSFDDLKGEKGLVFMLSRSFDW